MNAHDIDRRANQRAQEINHGGAQRGHKEGTRRAHRGHWIILMVGVSATQEHGWWLLESFLVVRE